MRWNSWVVQYDAESQLALVKAGAARAHAARLPGRGAGRAVAIALLCAAALLGAGAALRRRVADPLLRRTARFERLAARRGTPRLPHEGPLDHAERFARALPAAAPAVRRFAQAAAACRFGGRPVDAAALALLDAQLQHIRSVLRAGVPDRTMAGDHQQGG
jgi:hypothetical protein